MSVAISVSQINWQPEDYAFFRKCGEVTISPDEQCFGINCVFCPGICLQFEVFTQHIRETHGEKVRALYYATPPSAEPKEMPEKQFKEQNTQTDPEDMEDIECDVTDNNVAENVKDLYWNEGAEGRGNEEGNATTKSPVSPFGVELEVQPEAPQEEVGLVYIMESATQEDMEEETVDLFGMYRGRDCDWKAEHQDIEDNTKFKKQDKISSSDTEYSTDTTKSEFKCGEDIINYLLLAYKSKEQLWNPKNPLYKSNSSEEYNDISDTLLKDMNYKLAGNEICTIIKKLHCRYGKELTKLSRKKAKYKTNFKYFENLNFLRYVTENQQKERTEKKKRKKVVITKPKTAIFKENPIIFNDIETHLQFISIFKKYSALWDVDHPDYRSVAYRNEQLTEMLTEVNASLNLNGTVSQLAKTLLEMRKEFSVTKRTLMNQPKEELSPATTTIYNELAKFLENNIGPFQCDVCNMLIKTCDQYKIHKSDHNGTAPFICTLCSKGFQMAGNLAIHIRRHKRDFPYACEVCEKRFATSAEVSIHKRSHTGDRPYICDVCGKSFKTWSFFSIHNRTHRKDSNFLCPICDKEFYEKNRYTNHMNIHLNIRKHACTVCGKKFTTYANLKKHGELHLPEKKYKCELCDKRFAQFASLRWHRRKNHDQVYVASHLIEQ